MDTWNGIAIIDDNTPLDVLTPPTEGRGAVPRDYSVQPESMFAHPSEMDLLSATEIEDRVKEQQERESGLYHIYLRALKAGKFEWLLQGRWGYCWSHSTVHAVMLDRLKRNQPVVPLSAFAVAATIKKGRNEGGWCGLSAQFVRERGVPSQAFWPQGDANYRKYDKPEVWENAALHKITEDWVDLTRQVYDQNLTKRQFHTQLALGNPGPADFNWQAHSLCAVGLARIEAGSVEPILLNSWPDGALAGQKDGLVIYRGQRGIPDGALTILSTTPSDN